MSGTDIEVIDDGAGELQPSGNLFGTQNPVEIVGKATEIADALSDVLKRKGLAKKISGREFVVVEGWVLLGTMLGVFPVVVWTRKLEDGWEARVEARTLTGAVVGAAEAECLRSEKSWAKRDDYALRSMAQTRATSKALRGPLGFIVTLAGYQATPFEEMPQDTSSGAGQAPTAAGGLPAPDDPGGGIPSGKGGGSPDIPAGVGPSPDLLMTFGQHKGVRVGDLPTDYLRWLTGQLNIDNQEPFVADDEYSGQIVEAAKAVLERGEAESRRVAIGTLSSALKHAQEHGSLPPGHKDWASYLKWYIERYGIDPTDWRTALTPGQILEIAAHLHDQDIPI